MRKLRLLLQLMSVSVGAGLLAALWKKREEYLFTVMVTVENHDGTPNRSMEHLLAELLRERGAKVYEAHGAGGRERNVHFHFAVEVNFNPKARKRENVLPFTPHPRITVQAKKGDNDVMYSLEDVEVRGLKQPECQAEFFRGILDHHMVVEKTDGVVTVTFKGSEPTEVHA